MKNESMLVFDARSQYRNEVSFFLLRGVNVKNYIEKQIFAFIQIRFKYFKAQMLHIALAENFKVIVFEIHSKTTSDIKV